MKVKSLLNKTAVVCCALMAAPMVAMADENPLTDMVKDVNLTDATNGIVAAAGVLIGLSVVVYGAKRVLAFFGR